MTARLGLFEWSNGLKVAGSDWHLDGRDPMPRVIVSHAHADHLPRGERGERGERGGRGGRNVPPDPRTIHGTALCTPATAAIGKYRGGLAGEIVERDYFQPYPLDDRTTAELLPAGHVLGSAMTFVTRGDETMLYTGDFKLRKSRTVPPAEPRPADVLVTESTYGSDFFRFPPASLVEEQLVELAATAIRNGDQPVVYAYSLGKSQETIRILTDAGLNVTQHGAVARMSEFYEQFGVPLGRLRRYHAADFAGPKALDLQERGVLVAPPSNSRTGFTKQFGDRVSRIVMTGWALAKNAVFRYGVDHALPLSDHADFDELLETIEVVRPRTVVTHHGFAEFPEELARRGVDAVLARPAAQMTLF